MRRRTTLAGAVLSVVALIAVSAVPATAKVPPGKGLVSFGPATCEGLGLVEIFGPRGENAPTGYLIIDDDEETALHAVATRFELTFDDEVLFSKSFGKKTGLTTFDCTQTFEEDGATAVFTVTVALIPPR